MTRFFSIKQAYLYEQVLLPNRDEYDFRIKSGVGKSDRCKLAWFQFLGRDGPGNWTGIIETLIFLLQGPDQRLHSYPSILTSSTLALSFLSDFICFFGFLPPRKESRVDAPLVLSLSHCGWPWEAQATGSIGDDFAALCLCTGDVAALLLVVSYVAYRSSPRPAAT